MMYYLRRTPYINQIKDTKTNTISVVEYEGDRALYKSKRFSRLYRMSYPEGSRGCKLWTCKKLQTALQQRIYLFHYCNEWFEIYDLETNKPISYSMYQEYKPEGEARQAHEVK